MQTESSRKKNKNSPPSENQQEQNETNKQDAGVAAEDVPSLEIPNETTPPTPPSSIAPLLPSSLPLFQPSVPDLSPLLSGPVHPAMSLPETFPCSPPTMLSPNPSLTGVQLNQPFVMPTHSTAMSLPETFPCSPPTILSLNPSLRGVQLNQPFVMPTHSTDPNLFLEQPQSTESACGEQRLNSCLVNTNALEVQSVASWDINDTSLATAEAEKLENHLDCNAHSTESVSEHKSPSDEAEETISEYLLSLLSLRNRPTITEEQEEKERAAMTDEERAAVLSDMFGEMCAIGNHHPHKRARRDLDSDSIEFLIGQMRLELARIPNSCKQVLLEAQSKSHPEEFSDDRLLKFLRCEGMNAKLAAQRFVRYWTCRREVFGEDKYLLRMTLSEALKDDLPALEAGVYCLLPLADTSGRRLLYWEPHRHTRQGYTSESLRRAIWYTIECAAKESNDISSGIVQIHFERDTTLFDYDSRAHDCIANCLKSCWPEKMISSHICCPPSIPIRFLKPIMHAILGKEMRSRVKIHDVPESDIAQALSGFGILREMLPTHMGGKIVMNQSDWIAQRRAAELEEI